MKYKDLVAMWNEESEEKWKDIPEEKKIEFAFDEGRRSGCIEIAKLATKLSETERPFFK